MWFNMYDYVMVECESMLWYDIIMPRYACNDVDVLTNVFMHHFVLSLMHYTILSFLWKKTNKPFLYQYIDMLYTWALREKLSIVVLSHVSLSHHIIRFSSLNPNKKLGINRNTSSKDVSRTYRLTQHSKSFAQKCSFCLNNTNKIQTYFFYESFSYEWTRVKSFLYIGAIFLWMVQGIILLSTFQVFKLFLLWI